MQENPSEQTLSRTWSVSAVTIAHYWSGAGRTETLTAAAAAMKGIKIEPKKPPGSSKPNGCFQGLTFSVTDIFLESKKSPFGGIFICQIN